MPLFGRSGMRGHDCPVVAEKPITHGLPRLPFQLGASMPPHPPPPLGVRSKPAHGLRQGPGTLSRIEHSIASVVDALEQTAGRWSDDRNA